jgi:hypothetical protein
MSPRMLTTFFTSLVVFTIFLADLIWNRYRLAALQAKINRGEE